jgi:hypothetical protein
MGAEDATGQQRQGAAVRALVIERATGAVVGAVEADSGYGLWLALLDWGERQGVPRFQVPARYRTERGVERPAAAPAPPGRDEAEPAATGDPPPSEPAPPAQLALLPPPAGPPAAATGTPAGAYPEARPRRAGRQRRPAAGGRPAAEQLRLF